MNTTNEIMALARSYRDAQPGGAFIIAFTRLETAIDELVKQAAWAHHQPALLTEADAAADLAGPARPGAEPLAWLVCSVNKDGSLSLEHAAQWEEAAHEHINDAITEHGIEDAASWVVRPSYTHPAADLAGVARPGAEPYAYAVYFPDEAREELVHDLDDLLDDLTSCTHGVTPLYTTPQASQPLTDEQWNRVSRAALEAFFECSRGSVTSQIDCAAHAAMRATEKAHGIGAAQKGKP